MSNPEVSPFEPSKPLANSQAKKSSALKTSIDSLLQTLDVAIEVRLGQAEMTLAELQALRQGEVVTLDTRLNSPVDILLNQQVIAKGTLVSVDDHMGVKITELGQ